MEWVEKRHGTVVGVDTAPLIYFIEEQPRYIDILVPFFADLDDGRFQVVTSTVTMLEVLVHPLRCGDESLAQQYNDILLSSPHVATLPITHATAQLAAELRAEHKLKSPDAIQLAIASSHSAKVFLTNDRRIPRVSGLEVIRLKDLI